MLAYRRNATASEALWPRSLTAAQQGFEFPGNENPQYLEFTYFSFVIGITNQVSDVHVTSKRMRRRPLAYGFISFAFNAVILALLILNAFEAAFSGCITRVVQLYGRCSRGRWPRQSLSFFQSREPASASPATTARRAP